ncbi:MAG: hypothetical protein ABL962_19790, partial [Fimbriimonadaceae bacterium]
LQEPVRFALSKGEPGNLTKFEDEPGFVDVIAKIAKTVIAEWPGGDLEYVVNAANTVAGLKCASEDDVGTVWDSFREALKHVTSWDANKHSSASALSAIISHTPDDKKTFVAESIAKVLSKTKVSEPTISDVVDVSVTNWFDALCALHLQSQSMAAVSVPGGGLFALAILQQEVAAARNDLPKLEYTSGYPAIAASITSEIAEGRCIEDGIDLIKYARDKKLSFDWGGVLAACVTRLKTEGLKPLECKSLTTLVLGLHTWAPGPKPTQALTELASHGFLYHWVTICQGIPDAYGAVGLALIVGNPAGTRAAEFAQSANGYEIFQKAIAGPNRDKSLLTEIPKLAHKLLIGGNLYRIGSKHAVVAGIVADVLGALMDARYEFAIDPKTVVETQPYLVGVEPTFDVDKFLNEHVKERGKLISALIERGFSLELLPTYCWLTPYDVTHKNLEAVNFIWGGIEDTSKDVWRSIIDSPSSPNSKLVELVDYIRDADSGKNLGLKVEEAVTEYLREVRLRTVTP